MGELIRGPWPEPAHRNLTLLGVARLFHRDKRTVQRWLNEEPPVPHERTTDGQARFRESEVRLWLADRRESQDDAA